MAPVPTLSYVLNEALGQEDPLEEEMATHSSNLVGRILGTGKAGILWSMG